MTVTAANTDGLTARQREIFAFIFEGARSRGVQPTIREIGDRFGLTSPNAVQGHIRCLQKKGWLRSGDRHSRSLDLLRTPDGRPFRGFTVPDEEEVERPAVPVAAPELHHGG